MDGADKLSVGTRAEAVATARRSGGPERDRL